MTSASPTVLCHFRNEEVFLPYWLRHHTRLFDHGIMIDYQSSDRSVNIIRQMAPTWEIRPSRNQQFHSVSIDREVMDIENEIPAGRCASTSPSSSCTTTYGSS